MFERIGHNRRIRQRPPRIAAAYAVGEGLAMFVLPTSSLKCAGPWVAWGKRTSDHASPTIHRGGSMAPNTLADLYVEELKDLYSAEQQILKALPKIIKATRHSDLKRALETHRQQTEGHVERLERVFQELGMNAKAKKCAGMEGILEEGEDLIKEEPGPSVLDAGLISKAQHVEHYEMAGYGSVCAWANLLGHAEQARLLRQTLDEEKAADALLTKLATQSINMDAEGALANRGVLADRESGRATGRGDRGESDPRPSA